MTHVLMISLDTSLVTQPEGDSRRRHMDYARRAGRLTVIAYTPVGTGEKAEVSPELTILPTNSRHKLLFVADALRIAASVPSVDLITTQDPFVTGLVGVRLRDRLQVPLLVQNHSYFFGNAAWLAEKPLRNTLLSKLGGFVRGRADMYRTVNRRERDNYIAAGGAPERVVALPLGTASRRFTERQNEGELAQLRSKLGILPTQKVVLWVGYPVPFKRVPMLLEVFQRVAETDPDAKLLLVGVVQNTRNDLHALVNSLGIAERTVLCGEVLHRDLPLYYALGDVYVHTSAYEGVPRVLFEASAAGLPLVAMSTVGVDEVVEDGVNGYLVPDADINAMAERIVSLLRDPAKAHELGACAREIAFERYDAERYAEAWVAVWEQAVALGMKS